MTDALQKALADARSDVEAAVQHRDHIKADLVRAEAWVTKALKLEIEARFALRAATLATGDRANG